MRLALQLALKGEGKVAPNPMVGAVIVRQGRVVGQGYHEYFGGTHAEINAINSVRNLEVLNGATIYLTLEPCSHFGKTPPCAEALVCCGFKRVVIASRDPNPLVSGSGARLLKRQGINVIEGVLEKEARELNRPFFKIHQTGSPYVIAKWAMSVDFKMAYPKGQGRWITGKKSRDYAKSIRGQCQAVLVGIGTVLADDPGLLSKRIEHRTKSGTGDYTLHAPTSTPVRVILDIQARLPLRSKLVRSIGKGPVWVIASAGAPKKRIVALERKGVRVFQAPGFKGRLDFRAVLRLLVKNGINKLMIEGGAEVLDSAFKVRAVDEVYCFIAPWVIGGGRTASAHKFMKQAGNMQPDKISVRCLHPDTMVHGYTRH